jgi:small GTP-binding protein
MGESAHYKVVLLGNSGVGKTALVERVSEDIFQSSHVPTVGAQFISLELMIGTEKCILELWDTAGQEVFRSLIGFYARDAKGAFLLFDVADHRSFDDLPKWINFIHENAPDARVLLFGNKIDLTDTREITRGVGQDFADKKGIVYFEGSAKTGENVRDAFDRMTELLSTTAGEAATKGVQIKGDRKRRKNCC